MHNMQNSFRRSKLELHGAGNDLQIGLRSSRRVHSAPFCVQIPNPSTKAWMEGARGRELA
eukprot:3976992-Alexandrium_andersonii.AAC.1